MKVIILAGGSGTRLWPLSRRNFPKQFLKINAGNNENSCAFSKGSLIQQTAARFLKCSAPEDVVIITNNDYKFHVMADVDAFDEKLSDNLVLEPAKRNTAPAIALAMSYCKDILKCGKDEVLFITPADHVIETDEKFLEYFKGAIAIAKDGYIVTFGIKPFYPETGYGYIKSRGQSIGGREQRFFEVERFVEKPDVKTAEQYLSDGNYYWNSGMFAFTIGAMEDAFKSYAPEIFDIYSKGYSHIMSFFMSMPDISIDYAVMEKLSTVVTMPLDLYWNDVGSWDSMFDIFPKDEKGNVKIGDVIAYDSKNTLIMSEKRLIATVGLENLLVVETDDAILVAKRGDAQNVKHVVELLTNMGRAESDEHTTIYRPWGTYTVLESGERYKIKRIVVNQEHKLSLQMHHHRSEHWVIIQGTAKVTIGDEVRYIHENESVYIPKSTLHRLENPGKVILEIIEVQNGEYVGEDDIVRMDDVYGR